MLTPTRRAELLPLALLAGLLVWAPLPFGSVEPLYRTVVVTWSVLCLSAAVLCLRGPLPWRPGTWLPGICLLGVGALGWLQSIQLPEELGAAVSPGHWALVGELPELPERLALSVAPWSSRSMALVWAAMAGLWLASSLLCTRRRGRMVVVCAVAGSSVFQSIYGGQRLMGRSDVIWGIEVPAAFGRFRGTFVNPDHLAFYLGLCLPMVGAATFLLFRWSRHGWRPERRILIVAVPGTLWLMLFVGLALTGSRAGLLVAAIVAVLQGSLLAVAFRKPQLALLGATALLLVTGSLWWLSLQQQALGRLLSTSSYELQWNSRAEVYRATWELVGRFPATGAGLGSFREALSLVRPQGLEGQWWHAHSDYLELAATAGVVGLVAVLVAVSWIAYRLLQLLLRGRSSEARAAGVGGLGVLAAGGLHSTVDFGLSMPANAVTLLALLAVAVAVPGVQANGTFDAELGGEANR